MFKTKDIMTKGAVCVRKDTPIFEAIRIMVNNGITGVPVVEEDSREKRRFKKQTQSSLSLQLRSGQALSSVEWSQSHAPAMTKGAGKREKPVAAATG